MAILLCSAVSAQRNSVKRLIREGVSAEGVHSVNLKSNGLPIELSGEKVRVDGVELFFFDDESPKPSKERFLQAVGKLDDPDFETWFDTGKDGMRIWVLKKKGRRKTDEIVAIVTGDKPGIIRFKGSLSRDLIQKIVPAIQ